MSILQAIILAIIEGITEFLPISSTGHMIIAEGFMHTAKPEFTKLFTVNIQFGAILSVIVLYYKRFLKVDINFYKKLLIAFIPAAILGKLLDDYIDAMLGSVTIVAVMLLLGGIVLLFVDKWFKSADGTQPQEIKNKSAFIIGLCQCLAMVPGVSRSAATIIGGMSQKLNRKNAAEFSFFLAVPTMFAATAYKLLKTYKQIEPQDLGVLAIGNIVAFIVALLAIRTFITYLSRHGFKVFGYYRIVVGVVLLVLLAMGIDLKID